MSQITDSVNFHNHIVPYQGTVDEFIDLQEFSNEVVSSSIEFGKSQVFQKGIEHKAEAQPWILSILIFGFVAIALSRSIYRKRFNMLFDSLINWKLSKQIIRYENVYLHPVNILLTLNFIFCIPLFFSFFLQAKSNGSLLMHFGIALVPLVIYLFSKLFLYKFSGWLFGEEEAVGEYVFQTNLFNKYLGVAYLILTTLLFYSSLKIEFLYYCGLIVLGLFLLFQVVRGLIIGVEQGSNLVFIILYLCTLEILPWLAMGKWINNYL